MRSPRFTATVSIVSINRSLGAYTLNLAFNPSKLRITGVDSGQAIEFDGNPDGETFSNPTLYGSGAAKIAAYQVESMLSPSEDVQILFQCH